MLDTVGVKVACHQGRDGGQRGSNQGFVMVRGQAGGGIKQHGVFLLRGAGGPGGNAAVLRVSGAGKGQNGIENLLFQLRGHAGNVGRRHQCSIMENKRDIGTMPWGAAALNGEILIEEIAPHRAGFRPAADIAHGRLPEQYIQKRQVGGAAFGVGGVEQRQQGRGLLLQELDCRSDQVFIRDTRLDKKTVYKWWNIKK